MKLTTAEKLAAMMPSWSNHRGLWVEARTQPGNGYVAHYIFESSGKVLVRTSTAACPLLAAALSLRHAMEGAR